MTPVRGCHFVFPLALAAGLSVAAPARALRIVDYNLLNYPGSTGAIRDPYYRVTFAPLAADVVITEEQHSQAGVDEFLTNVLNTLEPGQWAAVPFLSGGDSQSALYYKPSKVQFLGQWGWYPNPANHLRQVNVYRLKPVGYSATAAEIRLYGVHLKASTGSSNVAQRAAEAKGIRDTLDALPAGIHAIVAGDFNFYAGTEAGMDTLLAVRLSSRGRLYDPLGLQNLSWQDNASMALYHTQCPSTTAYRPNGGYSGGGLDDRFDLLLPTYDLKDGEGVEMLPSTYLTVGNDGQHLNKSVTDAPIAPADTAYARALWWGSDHLPVRVDLSLPAQVSASTSPIAFGPVLVGASVSEDLSVMNGAVAPADTLEYGYAAPAGFTAPAGPIALLAGGSSLDAIGLDTSSPGAFGGDLLLNSNDLDAPALSIPVSGTVLAHAAASLDSLQALIVGGVDFGTHDAGQFTDVLVRVHDFGYDPLQSKLEVSGASITGPDAARFEIVGGFSPAEVANTAAGFNLHFDDAGAAAGTSYSATLTFTSQDEPLPGAAPAADLTLSLFATVSSGATAVADGGLPTETRLGTPFPNPLRGASQVRFDLARPVNALRLEVFDLSGRRVATLAQGAFAPGRYTARWNGRLAGGGTAGPGLYFVRMRGDGIAAATVRLAIVR